MIPDADTIEGMRTERDSRRREQRLIENYMHRERARNIDDYPEFYYG